MKKYSSIEQFRNVIHDVKAQHDYKGKDENGDAIRLHDTPYPVLDFKGRVKLHGTNAAAVKYKDRIEFQSRENVLTITKDNAGFCMAMSGKNLDFLFDGIEFNDYIAVYGEWCGQSIQKGVAISQLPKMFVIFGYKIDDVWIDKIVHDNEQGIYHIEQFPTWDITIDFNDPLQSQNRLVEITIAVETECPVGKHFGISGIGEGVVWTCTTNPHLKFKVKGEKHSSSKVKTIAAVNVEELNSINEFVEYALTESRLEQGFNWLVENHHELTQKSTGLFLSWINRDVVKEESDVLIENQLDMKRVGSKISEKARFWFFDKLNSLV